MNFKKIFFKITQFRLASNLGSSQLSLLNAGITTGCTNHSWHNVGIIPVLGGRQKWADQFSVSLSYIARLSSVMQLSTGKIGPHHYPRLFTCMPAIQIWLLSLYDGVISPKPLPHPLWRQGLLWLRVPLSKPPIEWPSLLSAGQQLHTNTPRFASLTSSNTLERANYTSVVLQVL